MFGAIRRTVQLGKARPLFSGHNMHARKRPSAHTRGRAIDVNKGDGGRFRPGALAVAGALAAAGAFGWKLYNDAGDKDSVNFNGALLIGYKGFKEWHPGGAVPLKMLEDVLNELEIKDFSRIDMAQLHREIGHLDVQGQLNEYLSKTGKRVATDKEATDNVAQLLKQKMRSHVLSCGRISSSEIRQVMMDSTGRNVGITYSFGDLQKAAKKGLVSLAGTAMDPKSFYRTKVKENLDQKFPIIITGTDRHGNEKTVELSKEKLLELETKHWREVLWTKVCGGHHRGDISGAETTRARWRASIGNSISFVKSRGIPIAVLLDSIDLPNFAMLVQKGEQHTSLHVKKEYSNLYLVKDHNQDGSEMWRVVDIEALTPATRSVKAVRCMTVHPSASGKAQLALAPSLIGYTDPMGNPVDELFGCGMAKWQTDRMVGNIILPSGASPPKATLVYGDGARQPIPLTSDKEKNPELYLENGFVFDEELASKSKPNRIEFSYTNRAGLEVTTGNGKYNGNYVDYSGHVPVIAEEDHQDDMSNS